MSEPKSKPELGMNWSRTEGRVTIRLNGATVEHGRVLANHITTEFLQYLSAQGYDVNTLRFSVRKRKTSQASDNAGGSGTINHGGGAGSR